MILRDDAIRIAGEGYPEGPECLARHLGVVVVKSQLVGVEGWCVRGRNTIIRVNSLSTSFRQRFTLAHELAHLVLGTEPDIADEPFRSDVKEEREADRLASELLIPQPELERYIRGQSPVDARTLERLSKAANVSPVVAAFRVVGSASELGLCNAALVFCRGGVVQWRYSQGLRFNQHEAEQLLRQSIDAKPNPVRQQNDDGNIMVASIIDAPSYQVLFIQLLPQATASLETREERLRSLDHELFDDDHSFRQSIAGVLGVVKSKCQGLSIDEAIEFFELTYLGKKYTNVRESQLRSDSGKEYIRLCLEKWFS